MKKDKGIVIASSVVVIAGLLAIGGILFMLKKTDPVIGDNGEEKQVVETTEVAVAQIETAEPMATTEPEATPEPEVTLEVIVPVIEATMPFFPDEGEQPIQEEPEKPDAPSDPPELKEGEDLTNPDKKPEHKEDPKPTEKPADTVVTKPAQENHSPGAIWVEGFGWIEYSGPNHGEYAPEIYMNGNKIGDM
ncbi:MAG: hypothetical protein K5678_00295 [Acetatifactor sp.]|nr:hypothetical protein [Acetatifactor sp.]